MLESEGCVKFVLWGCCVGVKGSFVIWSFCNDRLREGEGGDGVVKMMNMVVMVARMIEKDCSIPAERTVQRNDVELSNSMK